MRLSMLLLPKSQHKYAVEPYHFIQLNIEIVELLNWKKLQQKELERMNIVNMDNMCVSVLNIL